MVLEAGILAAVLAAECAFLTKVSGAAHARRHQGPQDGGDDCGGYAGTIAHDVSVRAAAGLPPDHDRYEGALERDQEAEGERIRTYAGAALVTGIGGTMLALAALLTQATWTGDAGIDDVVGAMGPALLASLFGVLTNLTVTLHYNEVFEADCARQMERLEAVVEAAAAANPPKEPAAEALRAGVAEAVREAFGGAVAETAVLVGRGIEEITRNTALTNEAASARAEESAALLKTTADEAARAGGETTRVLEAVRGYMAEISKAVGRKTADGETAEALRAAAGGVQAAVGILQGAAEQTEGAAQAAASMPEQLARTLEADRLARETVGTADFKKLAELAGSVKTLAEGLHDLPERIQAAVEATGPGIGAEFGRAAEAHVRDLRETARTMGETAAGAADGHVEKLAAMFTESTAAVVADTAAKVYGRIDETLVEELRQLGRELKDAMRDLPEGAARLSEAAARTDRMIAETAAKIDESAGKLERGAQTAEQIKTVVTAALVEANTEEMRRTREGMEKTILELIKFIRGLTGRLTREGGGRVRRRRRRRTPPAVWPAVADLMTVLAVVGTAAAAGAVADRRAEREAAGGEPPEATETLEAENRRLEDLAIEARERLTTLRTRIAELEEASPGDDDQRRNPERALVADLRREIAELRDRIRFGARPCIRTADDRPQTLARITVAADGYRVERRWTPPGPGTAADAQLEETLRRAERAGTMDAAAFRRFAAETYRLGERGATFGGACRFFVELAAEGAGPRRFARAVGTINQYFLASNPGTVNRLLAEG